MQQEAAQELIERERQQLLFVVVSGIAPTKRDLSVSEAEQAMVGDRYAMGVAAEILEHKLWSAEGWFQIDDPFFGDWSYFMSLPLQRVSSPTQIQTRALVERHYAVAEAAAMWNLSTDKVRDIFEHEPGVLVIGRRNPRKRPYVTLRIREYVVERVHSRLSSKATIR